MTRTMLTFQNFAHVHQAGRPLFRDAASKSFEHLEHVAHLVIKVLFLKDFELRKQDAHLSILFLSCLGY